MRIEVSVLSTAAALFALQAPFPSASRAADGGAPALQAGENRWVPSLAITSGVTFQQQEGAANSVVFEDMNPVPVPLQATVDGSDLAVSPFVGGSLELMTPAIPIPTRPRLFLSGEILPTFASEREVALDGNPGCIKGPRVGEPCASELTEPRTFSFAETAAVGQGTTTTAQVDTLVFGARLGVAFPARAWKRQLRIKPSVGWINYGVSAEGLVVDAACNPPQRCTDIRLATGVLQPGFLRETILTGSASQTFNGVGPGLDLEMDAYRYGPLGIALFLGAGAYRVLGDRTISFSGSEMFDDELGMDVAVANFQVDVNPWMYRAHVGIRFQWLGSPE